MNKLSIKLGILFFVILFGLIAFMFVFLHTEIADTLIIVIIIFLSRGITKPLIRMKEATSQIK